MRARDVSVRIERVARIPHGAKFMIDAPPGEDVVIWVQDDQGDNELAAFLGDHLTEKQCRKLGTVLTHQAAS